MNNGSLTSDEAVEEEESTEAAQPTPAEEAVGENSNSNAVMDLSGNVPASNKRLREGKFWPFYHYCYCCCFYYYYF